MHSSTKAYLQYGLLQLAKIAGLQIKLASNGSSILRSIYVMIGLRSRVSGDLASRAMAGLNPARCVFLIYVTLPLQRRNGSVQSLHILLS
jgi:hypothetical protein